MNIGNAIRRARLHAELSQSELAALTRTSQATISAYERGRKLPSAATLDRLLAATGSRLVAKRPTVPITVPRTPVLAERGRVLAEVIDLAERLPSRHHPRLTYPPILRTAHRAQ